MIQHINKLSILVILIITISCTESAKSFRGQLKSNEKITSKESVTKETTGFTTWFYYEDYPNPEYDDLQIHISDDSIKVTKAGLLICQGEIVKRIETFTSYFKSEKNGNEVRERLEAEYKINTNNDLLAIMNSYGDITDKGCLFPYGDFFIIDNHLFVYNKGYQVFKSYEHQKTTKKLNNKTNIASSKTALPYEKTIDINNVEYEKMDANCIKGLDKFSCGEETIRYLSLPPKDDISLILIPQDCGDFNYRYILLSIKNDEIISKLYVEGEFFEPEHFEETLEITKFNINKEHIITVITNKLNNNDTILKEKVRYEILEPGVFNKI